MAHTPWPDTCAAERVARTLRAARTLRSDIGSWLTLRRVDARFARFAGHFDALDRVTERMLVAVERDAAAIDPGDGSGATYERCRAADARLGVVARVYTWYADKYDQRLDDLDGVVLRAADEVVRSCWTEAFTAVDRDAPTGPLVYLDHRFDAVATPRVSVPSDLRAPGDALIGEFVRELPIPVVALPALCRTEPWWIVLAAHETGHHVQHDLAPDLVTRTRHTIAEAAGPPTGDTDSADCWAAWAQEVFADAFAALMVGPAAAWAVEELQHGEPARLVTMPSAGSRYPPPVVRTALLDEFAREAGAARPGPCTAEMAHWLDGLTPDAVAPPLRHAVAAQLSLVRPVVRALSAMCVDGVPLREVCGEDAGMFAPDGPVARWTRALHSAAPVLSGRTAPAAARHGIAAGVAAYRARVCSPQAATNDPLRPLREHLPALLAACGPPGTLAARVPPATDAVADRLAERLLTEVDAGAIG